MPSEKSSIPTTSPRTSVGWLLQFRELIEKADVTPAALREMAVKHDDLVKALSLTPHDVVLGMLMRECPDNLLNNYTRQLFVSDELMTLCAETRAIPEERRVQILPSEPPAPTG